MPPKTRANTASEAAEAEAKKEDVTVRWGGDEYVVSRKVMKSLKLARAIRHSDIDTLEVILGDKADSFFEKYGDDDREEILGAFFGVVGEATGTGNS